MREYYIFAPELLIFKLVDICCGILITQLQWIKQAQKRIFI
jgi:hypothetical protein